MSTAILIHQIKHEEDGSIQEKTLEFYPEK